MEIAGSLLDATRSTAEYAAAFDLEVWKAQQQLHFKAQLTEAKSKLEKRIREELLKQVEKKTKELESTREELEELAAQLEESGKLLKHRQQQFDAREAAFESRRVKIAEQHETHVARVERRCQQISENSSVAQDSMRLQLQEKDCAILQLRERLRVSESEYESLRRKATRSIATSQAGGYPERVESLTKNLHITARQLYEAEVQMKQQQAEMRRLKTENDIQAQHIRNSEQQIADLSGRVQHLQELIHYREEQVLADARADLEETKRNLQVMRGSQGIRADRCLRSDVVRAYSGIPSPFIYAEHYATSPREDTLNGMLQDLRRDVIAGMNTVKSTRQPRKRQLRTAHDTEEIVVDMPAGSALLPHHSVSSSTNASTSSTSCFSDELTIDLTQDVESLPPGATSITADVSALSTRREDVGRNLGVPSAGVLSPLTDTVPAVAPLPDDFVVASVTRDTTSECVSEEMTAFVHQLKINRQKLLDTGVYAEDHPVIGEMSEKIRLYEQYLNGHGGATPG